MLTNYVPSDSAYVWNPALVFPDEEYLSSAVAIWEPFLQTIPTNGGVISVGGSSMEVHPKAFPVTTKVWGKLEIDHTKWPSGYTGVTAMIYVYAENELLIPATLRMPSWCSHDKKKEVVMAHVLHGSEESSTWNVIKQIPLSSKNVFQFDCQDFSRVGVAIPDQSNNKILMHIDGQIYASPKNVFTLIFHKQCDLVVEKNECYMRKNGSVEISRFSTIQLEPEDKVQALLQVRGTEGFILDPEEAFEFDFPSNDRDAEIVKRKQISLDKMGGQNNVVKMGSLLKKDGKKIDGLHVFRYIWKDLQDNTAPQNLASVQVAQEVERSRQDLQTPMLQQHLQQAHTETPTALGGISKNAAARQGSETQKVFPKRHHRSRKADGHIATKLWRSDQTTHQNLQDVQQNQPSTSGLKKRKQPKSSDSMQGGAQDLLQDQPSTSGLRQRKQPKRSSGLMQDGARDLMQDQPTTSGFSGKLKKRQISKKRHSIKAGRKFHEEDKMPSQSQKRAKRGRARPPSRNNQRGLTINVFSNQQYDNSNITTQAYAKDQAKVRIGQKNSKTQVRSSTSRIEHNVTSTSDDEDSTDESDD